MTLKTAPGVSAFGWSRALAFTACAQNGTQKTFANPIILSKQNGVQCFYRLSLEGCGLSNPNSQKAMAEYAALR
jgi:hypothetical protein